MTEKPVNELVDHLFRHSAGQMVALLTRLFGFEKLDFAEDAMQDAMIAALKTWPFRGVPENPRAWLVQVAKNRMLDRLRRSGKVEIPADDDFDILARVDLSDTVRFEKELGEDVLRMMFACCHPSLSPDSQVALTLKTVGGFSNREIAAAFLSNEEAISKTITRAKQRLRDENVRFEMPPPDELTARLEAVLRVIYLLFNEGYNASEGERLVREDLCFEAIRLARLLAVHPLTGLPQVTALLALLLFQAARLATRFNERGEIQPLASQNRALWNRRLIGEGLANFRRSARGDLLTDYHLEAEAASVHALAEDFESTDWPRILRCYDLLAERSASPVIRLNRAIALAEVSGNAAGLAALESIRNLPAMQKYPLFHIVTAEFRMRLGEFAAAIAAFDEAGRLLKTTEGKRFVDEKKRLCREAVAQDGDAANSTDEILLTKS